ncbi:hypothetical protein Tco_0013542 [Tanacetum coccineum]
MFIDNILIYSKSKEEHEVHLKVVLELLKKEELFAKLSKCEIQLQEVHFFRKVVNNSGFHVDPSKIEVVKNWKVPKTPTKIRLFLGLAEEVKYAKEKLGVEFLSDYDCEIRYHPGKANIMSRVKRMILAVQSEVFKEENKPAERLHSLDQQMKSKDDGGCTLWTNYGIHCYEVSHVLWAEIREIQLIGPELVQETTSKVILIKEKLKAARDCQKSYEYWTDANMHVPLERIKVHKTLHLVEKPVKIIDHEVKSLNPSRISIVKVCWNSKRVKSQDEISLRRGYCDNCALSRLCARFCQVDEHQVMFLPMTVMDFRTWIVVYIPS